MGTVWVAVPAHADDYCTDHACTNNMFPNDRVYGPCRAGSAVEPPDSRGPICQTDNAYTSWWMERMLDWTTAYDTDFEHGLNLAMSDSYEGTDLDVAYDSTPVFSGTGETDIVYRSVPRDFYHDYTIGWTWCDDVAGTGIQHKCDQAYVNIRYPNDGYYNGRWLACHETGHAVGLMHGEDSSPVWDNYDARLQCMIKGRDIDLRFLGPMNVRNINKVY